MTEALFDAVTRIARHESEARAIAAIGEVVDVFDASGTPPDHAVTVQLRETGLLLPRVPIAVGALGLAVTPAAGDLVVVVFADGDVHSPVVVGRLYHSELAPPEHGSDDVVLALPPGAAQPALRAVLRRDPSLHVSLGNDVEITADDSTVTIKAGAAEAVVEKSGGGRVELSVGGASVTITGRGDISLKTDGKLTLEGSIVEIKGQASVSITGNPVMVN